MSQSNESRDVPILRFLPPSLRRDWAEFAIMMSVQSNLMILVQPVRFIRERDTDHTHDFAFEICKAIRNLKRSQAICLSVIMMRWLVKARRRRRSVEMDEILEMLY